jgi:uncharacterized protein (TIGR02145 family)
MNRLLKNKLWIAASAVIIGLVLTRCDSLRIWPAFAKTGDPREIGPISATLTGEVLIDKHTTVGFEAGTTTDYGGYYAQSNLSDETGTKFLSFKLTSLTPGTTYHYRVKVESRSETMYGDDIEFTTLDSRIVFNPGLNYGSVADVDGNTYKTIVIGRQTWMAENLKTTRFNDGTSISLVVESSKWQTASQAAYSWLNNEESRFKTIYGAYYNFLAVSSSKLCPAGWHVPTRVEWDTLTAFLGGVNNIGRKIKEAGAAHWLTNTSGNTNSSGFTALPGGYRSFSGTFSPISVTGYWQGDEAYWWTSTAPTGSLPWYEAIYAGSSALLGGSWRIEQGLPVRCMKD